MFLHCTLSRTPLWPRMGVAAGLALACFAAAARGEHTQDSLDTVKQGLARREAVIVDVREPDEWKKGHLADARLLPLSVLEKGMSPEELARTLPKDKIIYCHCLAGGRCLEAAGILAPLGYDVRPLKPGYPDLVKAGFPSVVGE